MIIQIIGKKTFCLSRSIFVKKYGLDRSEDARMSREKTDKKSVGRKTKVS